MNQVIIFEDTRIGRLQQEINKTITDGNFTVLNTTMTSIENSLGQVWHTVILVVTR